MAHAFVTGGATSESERDISVGGVSAVHPDVFDGVDYAALGHLHGPQAINGTVRYSGSPVALSFSEAGHHKASWLLDLSGPAPQARAIEAPVVRPVRRLRGTLEELLADPRLREAESAWCQVTLTDAIRPLGAMERVQQRFPHALVLQFEDVGVQVGATSTPRGSASVTTSTCAATSSSTCAAGASASEQERAVLAEAVEGSRQGRAVREDEGQADTAGSRRPAVGRVRLHRLQVTAFGPFARTEEVDFDELAAAGLYLSTAPPVPARPACSTRSASPSTPRCPARAPRAAGRCTATTPRPARCPRWCSSSPPRAAACGSPAPPSSSAPSCAAPAPPASRPRWSSRSGWAASGCRAPPATTRRRW